jgi:zinc protease
MTTSTLTSDRKSETGVQVSPFLTRGVNKTVLPNGLTVLAKELHDKPIVAAMIWYRVGSRNEELAQTGKSHFLEHMLFKGTDRLSKGEIDLITLKNGGANNAFTWLDFTAYYFTFASDRWDVALEIEANRMRDTTFAQEEFEAEKQVVQEELRIGLDGPWEALENEVWATAFRQHPYHWPTVGWLEDLEAATAADMKAYYDKWYHPRNATLVLVGDFDSERIIGRVVHLFGEIPEGPDHKLLHIVEPPQRGQKRVIVKKETPIERLLICYHAPEVAHSDSYVLQVAEAILSTGKSSRLYKRLVDRDQSVTTVKASYNTHIDPSLFCIQAELKPGFKLQDVESAIVSEIDRLKVEPISAAELEKAKRQIEAELVLATEEPLQQAILLGQYETTAFHDRIPEDSRGYHYLTTLMDRVHAVTFHDVATAIREYMIEDKSTVGYLVNAAGNNSAGSRSASSGSLPARASNDSVGLDLNPSISPRNRVAFRLPSPPDPDSSQVMSTERETVAPVAEGFSASRPPIAGAAGLRPARVRLEVERTVLPNGLTLLLSENHSSPSVSIDAVVEAGSRYESDREAGLASLTAELLDEGTTIQTSEQIAEAVESAGGRLRTYGNYRSSGIQGAFLSSDLPLALEIVADLLVNSIFPNDKVVQYVERRCAQLRSRLDVPRVQASDVFNELVFRGHPLHRPSVGYEQTVKELTRPSIVEFHRRFYVPNNTILAIVGDFNAAELKRRVEDLFGQWQRAELHLPQVPVPVRQNEAIERYVTAPKEQVNVFIGHLGIERKNPDYYALLVTDTILGSSPGFTSRIPRLLRDEQGLAYSTYSNITASAGIDPGRFVAYIGASPENLEQALSGLRGEIARIVREPVTADEIEGAKAYLTGNFVFDFQTNAQIAEFLVDAEFYNLGFDYLAKYPDLIESVTIADITRVTRKHLHSDQLTTVVVGPVDDRGKLLNGD